jgi:hypothetical protein
MSSRPRAPQTPFRERSGNSGAVGELSGETIASMKLVVSATFAAGTHSN